MASLSQLKFAMATSIFLSAFIFGLLVFAIVYFLQLDALTGLLLHWWFSTFHPIPVRIGPVIVAASTHLHYLKPGENPWLEKTVKEIADKSGLPMPRLATVPNNTPNAFTFGRTTSSATLAVHEGLLKQLNEDEIKGVIAHELGHIKHKDYIVMTVLSALPLIAYLIARAALYGRRFCRRWKKKQQRQFRSSTNCNWSNSFCNLHNNIPNCYEAQPTTRTLC